MKHREELIGNPVDICYHSNQALLEPTKLYWCSTDKDTTLSIHHCIASTGMAARNVDETSHEDTKLGMAIIPRYTLKDYDSILKPGDKNIFFQSRTHLDKTTVALCVIPGIRDGSTFYSKEGTHAEVDFIEAVQSEIKKAVQSEIKAVQSETKAVQSKVNDWSGRDVEIVMMLSKSPCFNCREELEVFFESLSGRITFVLRIANLYHGKQQTPSDIVIRDLMAWLHYLREENIIENFELEPISVTNELKGQ